VAQRVVEVGTAQDSCLLEAMAERLLAMLFEEFPVERVKLWVRKLHPPITYVTGSVGVTVERTKLAQQLQHADPAPARFLVQQLHRLPKGKVLDIAAGSGRHSLFLASQGYQVDAIDRDAQALAELSAAARTRRKRSTLSNQRLMSPIWGKKPMTSFLCSSISIDRSSPISSRQ
jgi:methylase of polypeptide subunit release factors